MLSLAKLGPGQQRYYLHSVARGVEDYGSGRGEMPGRWAGAGAPMLGLAGVVDGDALRAVLDGADPLTRVPLGRIRSDHVPGFDLTFGAPKSVSVLFGLGGFEIAAAVRASHDAATDAALGYLERSACWSRRGRAGVEQVVGSGFVGAAFRHRSSRNGDPHLHTHLLVANATCGPDGRWATLDARHLYLHSKTAGCLYQAHLRSALSRRLGVAWRPVANGVADLDGIPNTVLRAFSTRRIEIEAALAERRFSTPRAANIAALQTRRAKDSAITTTPMTERWRTQAHRLGLETDAMDAVVGRTRTTSLERAAIERTVEHLVGPDGLTAGTSSFDRRDVLRAWCDRFAMGADVSTIEALADHTIAAPQIVPLQAVKKASLRSGSGARRIQGPPVGASYSTVELLALERHVIERAAVDRGDNVAVASDEAVRDALHARPELADEQTALVVRLTTNGHAVDVVVAPAGTGKTFALDAARDAWQRSGRRVVGTALAARAAAELETSAGIPSQTIASLLIDLDSHHGRLCRDAVVIVDDAGMVGTRTLARLIDHAAVARAKVVLVGDPRQGPEIDAGGVLRGVAQRVEPIGLSRHRGQPEAWEREALRTRRPRPAGVALGGHDAHDRVVTAPTADATREVMVGDWWAASSRHEQVLMVATRRHDVDDLNARARTRVEAAGRLTGPTLELDGRPYQSGDRVMTLRNQRRLGVRNGTLATITDVDVDGRALTIGTDQATTHSLPAAYLDAGHLRHAYATTIHNARGITVAQTFVLGDDTPSRQAGSVARSRRNSLNRIYLVEQPERDDEPHNPQPIPDPLAAALGIGRAHELAHDRGVDHQGRQRKLLDRALYRLYDERERLERVRAARPHNPASEIRSLEIGRDQLEYALECQHARLDVLDDGHPLRHRRHRTAERLRVGDAVEQLDRQLERTRHDLALAHDQQTVSREYAAIHGNDIATLSTIGHEIDVRVGRLVASYRDDPPAYLAELGTYPNHDAERRVWDVAAHTVEHYRHKHHITDQHEPLGETRPPDHEHQHAREQLRRAARELTRGVGRASPGLDLSP